MIGRKLNRSGADADRIVRGSTPGGLLSKYRNAPGKACGERTNPDHFQKAAPIKRH
jgi:hypothetical protein